MGSETHRMMNLVGGPPAAPPPPPSLGCAVRVRGLRVVGVHGALPEERERAQPFELDLSFGVKQLARFRANVYMQRGAVAGALLSLVDPSFTPDGAASAITPGLTSSATDVTAMGTENYLSSFPYLGTPQSGYQTAPLAMV